MLRLRFLVLLLLHFKNNTYNILYFKKKKINFKIHSTIYMQKKVEELTYRMVQWVVAEFGTPILRFSSPTEVEVNLSENPDDAGDSTVILSAKASKSSPTNNGDKKKSINRTVMVSWVCEESCDGWVDKSLDFILVPIEINLSLKNTNDGDYMVLYGTSFLDKLWVTGQICYIFHWS